MPQPFYHSLGEAAHCYTAKFLSVPKLQASRNGIAQRMRFFDDCLEHRFKIAG